MYRFRIEWLSLLCCLVALVGCGEELDPLAEAEKAAAQKNAADTNSPAVADEHDHDHGDSVRSKLKLPSQSKNKVRQVIKRTSMTGRWLVRLMHVVENPNPQQGQIPRQYGERPVMLISVALGDGDDPGSVEVVAAREEFAHAKISGSKASKTTVEFNCVDGEGNKLATFRGRLADSGVVLGLNFVGGNVNTARLLPTNERTFARIPRFEVLEEQSVMMRLGNSPVPEDDLLKFAEDYPHSPLPRFAFQGIIGMFAQAKKPKRIIDSLIAAHVKSQSHWGKEHAKLAHVEALQWVAGAQYDPKYCIELVDKVEPMLDGTEGIDTLPQQLKDLRKRFNYILAIEQVDSEDEAEKKAGRESIREMLKENHFDPILIVRLADEARLSGRNDEAIDLYAQLVALPLQQEILRQAWSQEAVRKLLPSERLAKLWKGNKTGFKDIDKYLAKIYADHIYHFADKPLTARPNAEGNKVVLCESFTSSHNPFCVASTVALGGVQQTYQDSMVVVLRYYQQHNTAIDPISNEDSEIRCYNYYRLNGAPEVFIDGLQIERVGGPLSYTGPLYEQIRETIDENLKTKVAMNLSLAAHRAGDSVQINAQVAGADAKNKELRLRIVLAESGIETESITGIKQHDMAVRKIVGGDAGLKLADGSITHATSVDLKALRADLSGQLKRFEENYSMKIPEKPLDFNNLHVVAFVQDDATSKILQTIVVPVADAKPTDK